MLSWKYPNTANFRLKTPIKTQISALRVLVLIMITLFSKVNSNLYVLFRNVFLLHIHYMSVLKISFTNSVNGTNLTESVV